MTFRLILSIALTVFSVAPLAQPSPPVASRPATIGMVRGEHSLVAEIKMGPAVTKLWEKIQFLVETKPDLKEFESLSKLLNISTKMKIPEENWEKQQGFFINEIKGGDGLISSARWGMAISSDQERRKYIVLDLYFNLEAICLSEMEIQRVYGKGEYIYTTDRPDAVNKNPIGYFYGLRIAPYAGGFEIAPSGCAKSYSVSQKIE